MNYKHGKIDTRIYNIWTLMKTRCYSKNNVNYKDYGGRGITICDKWKNDFESFYSWSMNNGYTDDLTIDRIDNNGNYCPKNCRFATVIQQANNKTTNVYFDAFGEKKTLTDWARDSRCKVLHKTLFNRIQEHGWNIEKAIITPSMDQKIYHTYDNQNLSTQELINRYGCKDLKVNTFRKRLKMGWDLQIALNTPVLKKKGIDCEN